MTGPAPSATLPARVALALYPPSWRARYSDEVRALLDESGGGAGAVASLAWQALPAWIWPAAHLHDRPARIRASLTTGLMSWSFLVGLGLVFAQLTQFQGYRPAGHPVIGWSYLVFDAALAVSVLAAGLGGLPLWLLMLRRARRDRSARDLAYLLTPVAAPVAYLAAVRITVQVVGGPDGVSPWWFLAVTLAGFFAAGLAAAGPGLALRRLQPRGPALRLAATAAGVAGAAMLAASVAVIVAVTSLSLWAPGFAGHQDGTLPAIFLTLVTAAATVTAVSSARAARAARQRMTPA